MESQLEIIREVRQLLDKYYPECALEVDGGISVKTAARVKEAESNVLVAGSSVFGLENRKAAVENLRIA